MKSKERIKVWKMADEHAKKEFERKVKEKGYVSEGTVHEIWAEKKGNILETG